MDGSKLYLAFSKKQMDKGLEDLRQHLHCVAAWCCNNSLLIHPDKTKFCVFGTNQMLSQVTISPIIFLGKELATVDTVKDLRVIDP